MQDTFRTLRQAIGLVCVAGLLFVAMNALVKALTDDYNVVMLTWARYFFHVLTVAPLFPSSLIGVLRTRQPKVQLLRSTLLLLSTVFNFTALMFLPLGDAAAIIFVSPILVAGLAVLILHERVSLGRWLSIGAGFLGVLLVVRPTAGSANLGASLALACAATYALYQISTRMVREAEPIVSLLYSGLVGMLALTVVVPFYWQTPTAQVWLLLVLIGALGAAGHLLIILALQRAEASRVSPFAYVQLIWAMLASFLVFGDVPSAWTLAGAGAIVASGLALYCLDLRDRALRAAPGSDRTIST